jgi:hypothetical protein
MHPEPPATLPNTSAIATEATPQTHPIERRRPGRVAYTNPHLIALLRRRVPANPMETPDSDVDANARRLVYDFPKPAFAELPAATASSPELAEVRAILERLNAAWWTLERMATQWGNPRLTQQQFALVDPQKQFAPLRAGDVSTAIKEPNAAHVNAPRPMYDFPKPAFAELRAAKPTTEALGQEGNPDQFSAARGIGMGLLIALPTWAGIVAFGWWLIER